MRVKLKTNVKHHPFYPLKGDEITVHDQIGKNWVDNGWAINLDTGEEIEPNLTPVTLDIQHGILGHTTSEL